jgi:hypothetical protein
MASAYFETALVTKINSFTTLTPGQLAALLTLALVVLTVFNIFAPMSSVESILAKDLIFYIILFVVIPFIVVRRNPALSKFVRQVSMLYKLSFYITEGWTN